MTAAISHLIAGVSTFTLLALWFLNAYQVLSHKKQDLLHAEEQVRLLQECFRKMQNSPEAASAGRMLVTSIQLYKQMKKIYNEALLKPTYRFPGLFMGFRKEEGNREIREEEPMLYICEDCGFVFYGAGEIRECPYCGNQRISVSTKEKINPIQPFGDSGKSKPDPIY